MKRFAGLPRAHGFYALGSALKPDKKGKLTGPRKTVHEPVTLEKWQAHLDGTAGIGIVPIRTDNSVVFGAIDIDDYTIDLKALNLKVGKFKLPLIVCRTKSGGAHLYCFTKTAVPAELMRSKLMEWAIVLGHAGVEIFPKQVNLAREDDPVESNTGNWINVPYSANQRTLRYALNPTTGEGLNAEEFLALADKMQLADTDELAAVELPDDDIEELLAGAPPCTQAIARNGCPEGGRNTFLFSLGVYLKNRYGDDFVNYLDKYNQRFLVPPLLHDEVSTIMKSLRKKSYFYPCRQHPIVSFCNKQVCQTREYGIGGSADEPGVTFGSLTKLDVENDGGNEPTYIWEINGKRIEFDLDTLYNQRALHKRVIAKLDIWPNLIKEISYKKIVSEALSKIQKIEIPEDATREGQLWVHLSRFCTSRVSGRELDEILMGKPYTDTKAKITYFQAADFLQYLQQHRVAGIVIADVWRFLRRRGAGHAFKLLKGKGVNLWTIPAFDSQTEDFNVPKVSLPDKM
jgi:hypothetical protein